jgi:ribosome modulation factor
MTSKTAKDAKENPRAWEEGYQAGRHGLARGANPYPTGSDNAQLWIAGYLKGVAEIRNLAGK